MHVSNIERKYTSKPKLLQSKRVAVNRPAIVNRVGRLSTYQLPPALSVTDDEEIVLLIKSAFWILFLGVTPLILYFIINWFYPDFLMFPVTPN